MTTVEIGPVFINLNSGFSLWKVAGHELLRSLWQNSPTAYSRLTRATNRAQPRCFIDLPDGSVFLVLPEVGLPAFSYEKLPTHPCNLVYIP